LSFCGGGGERLELVRWTGVLGLAAIVAQLAGAVFGSVAGSAPSLDDPNGILAFAKNSHFALASVSVLFMVCAYR
jgi:hypothetical protein